MKHLKKILIAFVAAFFVNGMFLHAQALYSFKSEISGKGNPIIFIPGLISGGEVWEETVASFIKTNECHVITLAGFAGQKPLVSGPYLETFKKELMDYIADKKLKHVTLVGHSLGGYVSMMMALDKTKAIERIVIVDALPFFSQTFNPAAVEGFDEVSANRYMQTLLNLPKEQVAGMRLMTAKSMVSDSVRWQKLIAWANTSDVKTEAYAMHEMLAVDLRDELSSINIPILVLGAFHANPMYPQYTKEVLQQTYVSQYSKAPKLTLQIADSKHFIMYDQPEWMCGQIKDFISKKVQ